MRSGASSHFAGIISILEGAALAQIYSLVAVAAVVPATSSHREGNIPHTCTPFTLHHLQKWQR